MAQNNVINLQYPIKSTLGGTGLQQSTITPYGILTGGNTNTANFVMIDPTAVPAGYVLTTNGIGAPASFQAASGGGLTQAQVLARISVGV